MTDSMDLNYILIAIFLLNITPFRVKILSYDTVITTNTRGSIWRAWPVICFFTRVFLRGCGLSSALCQFRKDGSENEIEYEYEEVRVACGRIQRVEDRLHRPSARRNCRTKKHFCSQR